MAYGLDLRLYVENGPVQQSAVHEAIVRGASSRRMALAVRRPVPPPANDVAPNFGDGYPIAL